MYELKTKLNDASVEAFLNTIEDEGKRKDALEIAQILQEVSGHPAKMWGGAIVGFGNYRYKYPNGKEMDWMQVAFSPRKQNLTLYIMSGFTKHEELLKKLGKHKTGKGCLYINRLSDIDRGVLKEFIAESIKSVVQK